jgi:dynactin complex subunit
VLYSTNRALQKDLARVKTETQARQLAQEEAAMESSLAQADELSLLRKDKEELVRLRSEVANLRSLKNQITQLQEENQHLKSTIQQFQAASLELNALKNQNQQLQGALSQQQQQAHRNVCTANRRSIHDIKIRWAADFGKEATDAPEPTELFGPDKYVLQAPSCPSGGAYTLGVVEDPVTCNLPEHGDQ